MSEKDAPDVPPVPPPPQSSLWNKRNPSQLALNRKRRRSFYSDYDLEHEKVGDYFLLTPKPQPSGTETPRVESPEELKPVERIAATQGLPERKHHHPDYEEQPEPRSLAPAPPSAAKAAGGYSEAPAPKARRASASEEREKVLLASLQSLDAAQLRHLVSLLSKNDPKTWDNAKFFADKAKELKEKFDKKDWNKDFQAMLQMPDSELKFKKLYHLAHDFVYAARAYAKIIISELALPDELKTIQPADIGGIAGGTKFIVQNILFKFVLDFELKNGVYMYGGNIRSDENAMKSAAHEIKGCMSYFSCNVKGLCYPLMSVIDYKGFRLIAMSILPIKDGSLVYGSSNAGKTVYYDNPEINQRMEEAAASLNLKKHYVAKNVQLSSPGDLEVHVGNDGLYYMLDFARVFPAEGPDADPLYREKRQVYYKLLRPEFVRKWEVPLCSDAFTNWQKYDPERDLNNLEVLRATHYLHTQLIPEFAKMLDKTAPPSKDDGRDAFIQTRTAFEKKFAQVYQKRFSAPSGVGGKPGSLVIPLKPKEKQTVDQILPPTNDSRAEDIEKEITKLIEQMHRNGINLRHLGLVRSKVKSYRIRQQLLIEMVARVLKDVIRTYMRDKMREVKVLSEEPFKEVVVKIFSFVLGRRKNSDEFWNVVKLRITKKFRFGLSKDEEDSEPMTFQAKIDMAVLFRRLEETLGVRLTAESRQELEAYPDSFEFVQSDVVEVYPKVKHMYIVDYAEGMALYSAALRRNQAGARERLRQLRMAGDKFARALSTLPDSSMTLYQWGLVLFEEAQISVSGVAQGLLESACDKFNGAISINNKFQGCFIKYGEALIELAKIAPVDGGRDGEVKTAKRYFESAANIYSSALALEDFFFDVLFERVQSLHKEAIANSNTRKKKSRHTFYGVMLLCQVLNEQIKNHVEKIYLQPPGAGPFKQLPAPTALPAAHMQLLSESAQALSTALTLSSSATESPRLTAPPLLDDFNSPNYDNYASDTSSAELKTASSELLEQSDSISETASDGSSTNPYVDGLDSPSLGAFKPAVTAASVENALTVHKANGVPIHRETASPLFAILRKAEEDSKPTTPQPPPPPANDPHPFPFGLNLRSPATSLINSVSLPMGLNDTSQPPANRLAAKAAPPPQNSSLPVLHIEIKPPKMPMPLLRGTSLKVFPGNIKLPETAQQARAGPITPTGFMGFGSINSSTPNIFGIRRSPIPPSISITPALVTSTGPLTPTDRTDPAPPSLRTSSSDIALAPGAGDHAIIHSVSFPVLRVSGHIPNDTQETAPSPSLNPPGGFPVLSSSPTNESPFSLQNASTSSATAPGLSFLDYLQQKSEASAWSATPTSEAAAAAAAVEPNVGINDPYFGDEKTESSDLKNVVTLHNSTDTIQLDLLDRPNTPQVPLEFGLLARKPLMSEDDLSKLLYLKRIRIEALELWANAMIHYGCYKKQDGLSEALFSDAAEKYYEALTLDASRIDALRKVAGQIGAQARENRRLFYAAAQLYRVISSLRTDQQLLYDWGSSLLNYAKVFVSDSAKYMELHQIAGERYQRVLELQANFFDSVIQAALKAQRKQLESLLRLVGYCTPLGNRIRLLATNVTQLDLKHCSVAPEATVDSFCSFAPHLQSISLKGCKRMGKYAISSICDRVSHTLKVIDLTRCAIDDSCVKMLCEKCPNIEDLSLKLCSAVTDLSVEYIATNSKSLKRLDLKHCKLTSAAPSTLARSPISTLEYLSFALCAKIEDAGIMELAREGHRYKSLNTLKLTGCSLLTDDALAEVGAHLPSLRELHIQSLYKITDWSVKALVMGLPQLRIFKLRNCKGTTWKGLGAALKIENRFNVVHLDVSKIGIPTRSATDDEVAEDRNDKLAVARILADKIGPKLQGFEASECHLSDEALHIIASSFTSNLKDLDLSDSPDMSNKTALMIAANAPNLERLHMASCRLVNETGVSGIVEQCRKLVDVNLLQIVVPDETIRKLSLNLPKLNKLILGRSYFVTDSSLTMMACNLPLLKHLDLSMCNKISDAGLEPAVESLTNLQHLNIDSCNRISNKSLAAMARFAHSLKHLILSRCTSISDKGVIALAEGVPSLVILDLAAVERISDESVYALLKHQPLLEELCLKDCSKISERALSRIAQTSTVKIAVQPAHNSLFQRELAVRTRQNAKERHNLGEDIEHTIMKLSPHKTKSELSLITPELKSKFELIGKRYHQDDETLPLEPLVPDIPSAPSTPKVSEEKPTKNPSHEFEPFNVKFTFAQLTTGKALNCDPLYLEKYLTDTEFEQVFRMSPEEFAKLAAWKQRQLKIDKRLF